MGEPVPLPQDWSDYKQVEAWLRTQPRELCITLAARAALRVLPLVGEALDRDPPQGRSTIVLPSFRANVSAWLVAMGPSRDARAAARAAAAYATAIAVSAENAADLAAYDASAAAAETEHAAVVYAAAHAAFNASAAGYDDAATYADAHWVTTGGDPPTLARRPLWPETAPEWAQRAWADLRTHLLAANEGWEVWTDWYDARLNGDPVDLALETRRVIEPKRWDEGPAAINAEIKDIIEDHRRNAAATLVQDRRGAVFVERDGRLAIDRTPSAVDPRVGAMQPRAVEVLNALANATRQSNQFAALGETAARLAALVGQPPELASAHSFEMWSLSGDLGQWRRRDDEAQKRVDGFVTAMNADIRQALDSAVPVAALYVRSFDEARRYDEELGVYEGQHAPSSAQHAIIAAARRADAIEPADAGIIEAVICRGDETGPLALRAAKSGSFSTQNMVIGAAGFVAPALVGGLFGLGGVLPVANPMQTRRLETFLVDPDAPVDALFRDAPEDIRQAVDAIRSWVASRR